MSVRCSRFRLPVHSRIEKNGEGQEEKGTESFNSTPSVQGKDPPDVLQGQPGIFWAKLQNTRAHRSVSGHEKHFHATVQAPKTCDLTKDPLHGPAAKRFSS